MAAQYLKCKKCGSILMWGTTTCPKCGSQRIFAVSDSPHKPEGEGIFGKLSKRFLSKSERTKVSGLKVKASKEERAIPTNTGNKRPSDFEQLVAELINIGKSTCQDVGHYRTVLSYFWLPGQEAKNNPRVVKIGKQLYRLGNNRVEFNAKGS